MSDKPTSAENMINAIMAEMPRVFPTFGGGVVRNPNNPLAHWTKDEPMTFAAGVKVRDVVEVVAGLALQNLLDRIKEDP